jgi:hypothetical protein
VLLEDIVKVFVHLVPVDNIPPVGDVLGAAVLVLEVVGVLPDVDAEDGVLDFVLYALHQRVVLVWGTDDLEFILAVDHEPDPANEVRMR